MIEKVLDTVNIGQNAGSYLAVILGFTKKTSYMQDIYLTCKI